MLENTAASQLSKLLTRQGGPDPDAIVSCWVNSVLNGHISEIKRAEAIRAVRDLLFWMEEAMRDETVFQTLFDSRDLDSLPRIEKQLAELTETLKTEIKRVRQDVKHQATVNHSTNTMIDDRNVVIFSNQSVLQELSQEQFDEFRDLLMESERRQCANLSILNDRSVSTERGYQVLPMLYEVLKEELPREEKFEGRFEDEESQRGTEQGVSVDILQWEEGLLKKQATYKTARLEEIFQDFRKIVASTKDDIPHLIVLGPPGSGKSSLGQYLAYRAAGCEAPFWGKRLISARVRLQAWERWMITEHHGGGLAEYLADQSNGITGEQGIHFWRKLLSKGQALILLDGLDEVNGSGNFLRVVKRDADLFRSCMTVITCRTVSFEKHRALLPDFPIFTLGSLDRSGWERYIRTFKANFPKRFQPEELIQQLNGNISMQLLATNPLLLSILCFVVDDPKGVTLPARRVELYDQAVNKLLARRPKRVEIDYPCPEPPVSRKRRILEETALRLFLGVGGERKLTFSEEQLLDAVCESIQQVSQRDYTEDFAAALLCDVAGNTGLLRGDSEIGYTFLHLTIHEYLAAAALARRIEKGGWEAPLQVGSKAYPIRVVVDEKAWLPEWREVICLLAGQLTDPIPLVEWLSNPTKDDVFLHRTGLAVQALSDALMRDDALFIDLRQKVMDRVFTGWWNHQIQGIEGCVFHLRSCLPVLVKSNYEIEGKSFQAALVKLLDDSEWGVRSAAARTVGTLRAAAATAEFLTALAKLLDDPEREVTSSAAQAIRSLGEAAATSEFLAKQAKLLADPVDGVHSEAARAIRTLEPAAATADILEALTKLLGDHDKFVRYIAVDVIRSWMDSGWRFFHDERGWHIIEIHDLAKLPSDKTISHSGQ